MKHHRTNGNHLQKPRLTKVAATVLAILSSSAHANSDKLVNPANSHAYQRLDSALDWNTAKSVCSNMGAHLATITSQAENAWLTTNFTNGIVGFWLGATDEVQEGTWKWITNETWSYTNWNSGEPNNSGGENYLNMWGSTRGGNEPAGMWNDCRSECVPSAVSTYLCEWEPTPTTNVYNNDFSTSAGAEWTDPTIATSNGEKFLGASANGFGAGSNTLTLNNLPPHSSVTVDFDLYVINSWDGNGPASAPDNWQLTADGNNVLLTNFENCGGQTQAYPNQLSPYGSGGSFASKTGAYAINYLLAGDSSCWSNATYRLSYTFEHTAASVALKFTGMQNEAADNEGWGLDNVRVSVNTQAPLVTTLPVTNITDTSATLNAQVNSNGDDATVDFNFGTTTNYGDSVSADPDVVLASTGSATVTGNVTDLDCNSTYHYRVAASNSFGTNYGADASFTTAVCPVPPTATTNAASGITTTAAILSGTINPNGIPVTANNFEYGPSSAYGTSKNATPVTLAASTNNSNVSATVGGLTCNSVYHYRVNAVNSYGTGHGADKTLTTLGTNCVAVPICTTTAATNVASTSATLNGSVQSSGATATASFELGTSTSYGATVAATPSQVYSATPVAIVGTKTGLNCGATYHYRSSAVNSKGTGVGTDQTFTTGTCDPATWLYPLTQTTTIGSDFSLDIHVNTNGIKLGGYNLGVTFDPTKVWVDTTYQNVAGLCDEGVCPGTGALASMNIVTDNSAGTIRLAGFDTVGSGPSNDLQLAVVHLVARATTAPGTTPVNLTATELLDPLGGNIGNLAARGATVKIDNYKCGDADGNGSVNIVDALAIARQVVGLPPPPTVNPQAADVNGDGIVGIADAMFIARNSVGLLVVGTCLQ